ncbi:ankyrin [Annulohypoxylon bovei var. microspora]|nr:ankyrin [Annulohypoxylon bovei var. microspora]
MTTTLNDLPTEILFSIANICEYKVCWRNWSSHDTQDIFASLALTNRRLHDVFNPILWRFNRKRGTYKESHASVPSAVGWATLRNRIDILEIAVKYQHSLGSFLENHPIQTAAKLGYNAMVSWLLDHGVPMECVPCDKIIVDSPFPVFRWPQNHVSTAYSALFTALISGQQSTAVLLLSRGAKYQFKDDTNTAKSAIHFAAFYGLSAVVEYMVKTMGIMVHQEDQDGMTPLHYAVKRNHNEKAIKVLLDLGADMDTEQYHQSPLVTALKRGNFSNVMMLLDAGAKVNPTRDDHEAPLVVCACESFSLAQSTKSSAQYHVLRKIIANGAILDKSFREETALCSAVENGTTAAVYELLRAGADVQIPRERDGLTPFDLLWTTQRTDDEPFRNYNFMEELGDKASLLIAAGARLDTRHFNNKTHAYNNTQLRNAVDYCLARSPLPLLDLLRFATPRNVCDGYINELFETCLKDRQLAPARILMHHGATSSAANELAFVWATEIIKEDDGGVIEEAFSFCLNILSAQQIEELFFVALECAWSDERCQQLIDRGAISCLKETNKFKPWLHLAVPRGSSALIRRLVKAGMDINALDEEYKTPMMIALEEESDWETAGLLFELGADPFHPRPDAECRRSPNTSTEIISPFELAIRRNHLPEIRRWWLNTPPESRPTGEILIPRVLSRGPWHQNYLKYLRNQTDNCLPEMVDENLEWGEGWIKRCEMRKFDEGEEKKSRLMFAMDLVTIHPYSNRDDYRFHFWD